MSVKVRGVKVHLNRPLTDEERQDSRYVQGDLIPRKEADGDPAPGYRLPQGPDLANRLIERDENRIRLPLGEGHVCLSVCPGEELGEIYVGCQFEGPKGQWDECMRGQNRIVAMIRERVIQFLKSSLPDRDFDIHFDVMPCERSRVKIDLQNEMTLENETVSVHAHEHDHHHDAGTDPGE